MVAFSSIRTLSRVAALSLVVAACEPGGGVTTDTAGEVASTNQDAEATEASSDAMNVTDATSATDAPTETGDAAPYCGDGELQEEQGEECDGVDVGAQTCASKGFVDGGVLACTDSCEFELSGCFSCSGWGRLLGGPGMENGRAIALDSNANVYITGSTSGQLDGRPAEERDAFIAKYGVDGHEQWTRTIGTALDDDGLVIAVDGAEAIYVAGSTDGALDGFVNTGQKDIFLMRLNSDGETQWTLQYGSIYNDVPSGLLVDSEANVYLYGANRGPLDGNEPIGLTDAFLTKLGADGSKQWTRVFGTAELDNNGAHAGVGAAAIDTSDNIFLVGTTEGLLGDEAFGSADVFVAKLDTDGLLLWARQLGSASYDSGYDVSVDPSGNVLVLGHSPRPEVDPPQDSLDFSVSKLDTEGGELWRRHYGTDYDDYVYGISATSDGGFWVVGGTRGDLGGAPPEGLIDTFFSRHDEDGETLWVHQFASGSISNLSGSVVDPLDNLYAVGTASGALDGVENAGGNDVMVLRACASADRGGGHERGGAPRLGSGRAVPH